MIHHQRIERLQPAGTVRGGAEARHTQDDGGAKLHQPWHLTLDRKRHLPAATDEATAVRTSDRKFPVLPSSLSRAASLAAEVSRRIEPRTPFHAPACPAFVTTAPI